MNHPKTKRNSRTHLFFIYSLMVIAVITMVAALVLVMLGYRFNRYDGKIEQGGLVQFDSRPAGATVTLDAVTLANRTANKVTAQTGDHTITMTKNGYTTWRKNVTVQPGSVLWLNYATLLPTKPTTKTVATYASIADAMTSPDRRYLAVLPGVNDGTIAVVDLNGDASAATKVTLAAADYTAPEAGYAQSFHITGWDRDSRHVLIRHTYAEAKQEYLSVDLRGGDQTRNITRSIGVDMTTIEYSLASSNTLYLLTPAHELRRVDLAASTVTGPLLTGIASFAQADRSTIVYSTVPSATAQRTVGYLTNGAAAPRVVRAYTDNAATPIQLRIGSYFGNDYVTIIHGSSVEILRGKLPSSDALIQLDLTQVAKYGCPANVTTSDFSPGANRFVVTRCGANVATYDLETLKLARATVTGDTGASTQWIDGYHWTSTSAGSFDFYDFDGTNRQVVATVASKLPVTFSENSKYYYHFTPSGAQTVLVRTKSTTD